MGIVISVVNRLHGHRRENHPCPKNIHMVLILTSSIRNRRGPSKFIINNLLRGNILTLSIRPKALMQVVLLLPLSNLRLPFTMRGLLAVRPRLSLLFDLLQPLLLLQLLLAIRFLRHNPLPR